VFYSALPGAEPTAGSPYFFVSVCGMSGFSLGAFTDASSCFFLKATRLFLPPRPPWTLPTFPLLLSAALARFVGDLLLFSSLFYRQPPLVLLSSDLDFSMLQEASLLIYPFSGGAPCRWVCPPVIPISPFVLTGYLYAPP